MGVADEAAFRAYVAASQQRLLRTAWLLTGDWPAAEDLAQAALVRCWPHWDRIVQQGGPDAYVHRTMANLFVSSRRRFWHREVATDVLPETAADGDEAASDLRSALVGAVRQLPPRQRAVIALRYLADMTEQQVADALGCSTGTVKSQTSKALGSLRALPDLQPSDLGAP